MSPADDGRQAECSRFVSLRPPRRPTRVDWDEVARQLAQGRTIAQVADSVGCSRRHIWRILRNSRRLDRLLADAQTEVGTGAHLQLAGLRPAVAERLGREVEAGNVRVLLWLADRLTLFERPAPLPDVSPNLMPYRDWVVWNANREAEAKAQAAERAARDLDAMEGLSDDEEEEDQWLAESGRREEESE
jgi:hypothetical protein